MTVRMMRRLLPAMTFFAMAVAIGPATALTSVPPPSASGRFDPAAAWERFLATADSGATIDAYDALDAVGFDGNVVEADRCTTNRKHLTEALAIVPVSVALRWAAYLCAQATGDSVAADRAMGDLVALSRNAMQAGAGDGENGRPIRVVAPVDASALVRSSGLDIAYFYYPQLRPRRYFPLVIAARDPATSIERHFAFDFIDVDYILDRKHKFAGFPLLREDWADAYVSGGVKSRYIHALDIQAVRAAEYQSAEERLQTLPPVAALGGIESAKWWLETCQSQPSATCADGLVDALLPQAEKHLAYPMILLALAQLDAVGTKRDADAAWALLDGANHQWPNEAIAEFTRIWLEMHSKEPLPAPLVHRLETTRAAGDRYYQRLLIDQKVYGKDKPTLDAGEIQFLSDPANNRLGQGYEVLAEYHEKRGEIAAMLLATRQGADAGSAYSQYSYGFDLDKGKNGLQQDHIAGRQRLAEAAHGGNDSAMIYLGNLASSEGRWSDAEAWELPAMHDFNQDAAADIAYLYEKERPGVTGDAKRAVEIYRALDADGSAFARRRLADLALDGRGMPRDPEQARKWLLADANKDDPQSQIQLGLALANGRFGQPDEANGVRWMERAVATKDEDARNAYASWLYNKKATREARLRALALWTQGDVDNDRSARNNLAWALCTGADEDFDPVRGLAVMHKVDQSDGLPAVMLDTLAACYAGAGNFKQATVVQQQAIDKVSSSVNATPIELQQKMSSFNERLALYRAGKRYRVPETQSSASKPNNSVSLTSSPTK